MARLAWSGATACGCRSVMYPFHGRASKLGNPLFDLDQKDFWKVIGAAVGGGIGGKLIGKLIDLWRPTKIQEIEADEQFLARVMARCLQLEGALDAALKDHEKTMEAHRTAMEIVHQQYEARLDVLRGECERLYHWAIRRGYDPDAEMKKVDG